MRLVLFWLAKMIFMTVIAITIAVVAVALATSAAAGQSVSAAPLDEVVGGSGTPASGQVWLIAGLAAATLFLLTVGALAVRRLRTTD